MKIYKCKAAIEGNKIFAREYEIESSASLYDLHRHIQNDLDFDGAQLVVFFTSNKKYERIKAIPFFDMGDGAMDSVFIEDLIADDKRFLLYVFDIHHNRQLQIELMFEVEFDNRASYPQTVLSKGNAPNQFSINSESNDISFEAEEVNDYNDTI